MRVLYVVPEEECHGSSGGMMSRGGDVYDIGEGHEVSQGSSIHNLGQQTENLMTEIVWRSSLSNKDLSGYPRGQRVAATD